MLKNYSILDFYILALILVLLVFIRSKGMAAPPDSLHTLSGEKYVRYFFTKNNKKNNTTTYEFTDNKNNSINDKSGLTNFFNNLHYGGYYRMYAWSRNMVNAYAPSDAKKVMTLGDGYYDPMLLLYLGGAPTTNTSLGAEVMLANPFEAYKGPGAPPRTFNSYYGMVLRGNAATKYGTYSLVAGGIEWRQLTSFTFGSNLGYQRYSVWERRPWDPETNLDARYRSYYYKGSINQDPRFGAKAFKGFLINGYKMPFNTSFDLFYGKTDNNAGYDRESIVRPKSNLGIKFNKKFKNENRISLNTFNSYVRTDSINNTKPNVQWNIYTTEFNFNLKDFNLNGEVGFGGYESPTYKRAWSEGILVNLGTPAKYTALPFSFRYFQIGQNFTSNVAKFTNTTIGDVYTGYNGYNAGVQGASTIVPFGGVMSAVGDLANNRQGGAVNTEVKIWKFKLIVAAQAEKEMSFIHGAGGNTLNYYHRINSLTWSRLPGVFPLNGYLGPNGRVGTVYRGAYEIVKVDQHNPSDSTLPLYKKGYSSMDVQLKFAAKIFNKDFYLFSLNSFLSAQNKFSLLPVFNNDAYITARYHETEAYYELSRWLVMSVYGGLEYIKGNKYTDTTTAANGVGGVTGKARNQIGRGFGIGADIALTNHSYLFIRQRWFSFDDKYFLNENFQGQETTVELKIYF